MTIQKLYIENFRAFKSLNLETFRRVNVIVGQEGKTSLLEAIWLGIREYVSIKDIAKVRGVPDHPQVLNAMFNDYNLPIKVITNDCIVTVSIENGHFVSRVNGKIGTIQSFDGNILHLSNFYNPQFDVGISIPHVHHAHSTPSTRRLYELYLPQFLQRGEITVSDITNMSYKVDNKVYPVQVCSEFVRRIIDIIYLMVECDVVLIDALYMHYKHQKPFWNMINELSVEYNTQVIYTTNNYEDLERCCFIMGEDMVIYRLERIKDNLYITHICIDDSEILEMFMEEEWEIR